MKPSSRPLCRAFRSKFRPRVQALATLVLVCAAAVASPSASAAQRACGEDPRVIAASAAWTARVQQPPLAIGLPDAPCFRSSLMTRLKPQLGPVIGYKVGVWTAAARASYHVTQPAVGVLLRGMILPEGRPIPIGFAFAPMAEADFLLVIRDEGINGARSREEAYAHIRGYRPFIELPDNHYPAPASTDFARLVALDVNARAGVMGAEIPLPRTAAGLAALSALSAEALISGPTGTRKESALAINSLGDPLEIALAARDELARQGIRLKGGDLISIGSLTPPHAPAAGEIFAVEYQVGPQVSHVRAQFTR